MREISPAVNMSVEQYLAARPELSPIVAEIRRQKLDGERIQPSKLLIDRSSILSSEYREKLLDKIAQLVDENVVGRSDMCLQFADLLNRSLVHMKFPSRAVVGKAIYHDPLGNEIWRWDHAWVRVGSEVVDGNVDILSENPVVPHTVSVKPYWGALSEMPAGRRLREAPGQQLPLDEDVERTWWPDLKAWVDSELRAIGVGVK